MKNLARLKMNTNEIYRLVSRQPLIQCRFRGVFPSNRLPACCAAEGFYVANLDEEEKEGSHWVAFDITPAENEPNIYFDSYGFPPTRDAFRSFMGPHYIYNKKRCQHALSTACAQWCLYFMLRRSQNWTLPEIVRDFVDQGENHTLTIVNDHAINMKIEELFDTDLCVINRKYMNEQVAKKLIENYH